MTDGSNAMNLMGMRKKPARNRKDIDNLGYQSNLKPIDAEWKERISQFWWGTEYTGYIYEHLQPMLELRDRLLAIDGEEACLPEVDDDLEDILEYGQIWVGKNRIKMMKGVSNQCHTNSCCLWRENKNLLHGRLGIATGYALSDDGMWCQHSWCIWKGSRYYKIIETTEKRELYYGFCMLGEDAERFCDSIL